MNRPSRRAWAGRLLWFGLFWLLCGGAHASVPVTLYKSWAGKVNFTGTVASMRTDANCSIQRSNTKINKTLAGIPAGATVLAAHLYWAGSASSPDTQVTFDGKTVKAGRQYTTTFNNGGTNFQYFGAAADVTSIVQAKGNGTYSFYNLSVSNGNPWCNVSGVLGGFALLVVYEHASQPFRVLNLYEGFQYTRYSSLVLNLSNFRVPDPLAAGVTGRIGHITWEGDLNLDQDGENLKFNGYIMTDGTNNPPENQFNSFSNINNTTSYGIDFDAYSIEPPRILAGQSTATTAYSSGQDMVLLAAEIVAVPNVPTADLAISMTRTGDPLAGSTMSYALAVSNNGPDTEPGPVQVTNTIPSGTSLVSAGGTGWTCSVSGATLTCNAAGPLAKGVALPLLNIVVRVDSVVPSYTNTASVVGTMFDNVSSNSTASDTVMDTSVADAPFVITDSACANGVDLGTPFSGNPSGCRIYTGPYDAASTRTLYITAMSAGKPTAFQKANERSRSMRFSLSCADPATSAGVAPTFAGRTLPTCYAGGTIPPTGSTANWTTSTTVDFVAGAPSVAADFRYADVGRIRLNVLDMGMLKTASTVFVSIPSVTYSYIRNSDGGLNPEGASGFAKVNEPFDIGINLRMSNGAYPPNFGNEAGPYGPVQVTLERPAGSAALDLNFVSRTNALLAYTAKYGGAGNVALTASLMGADKSLKGTYFGVPLSTQTKTVGQFYPAYYTTKVTPGMGCLARMICPADVAGAAYSGQPFTLTTEAFDYVGAPFAAASLPVITIKPVDKPGPTGVPLTVGSGAITSVTPASIPAGGPWVQSSTVKMSTPFDVTTPRATNVNAPTSIYFRASSPMTRRVAGPAGQVDWDDPVSSSRSAPAASVEGGVRIVQGRLLVSNALGSELIKLPVHLMAQYWTGASWENNTADNDSPIDQSTASSVQFTNCTRNLAVGTPPNNCKQPPLALQTDTTAVELDKGAGTIVLQKPGAGFFGSARVRVIGTPVFLPSTIGRAVFGVPKSPMIYIREVY